MDGVQLVDTGLVGQRVGLRPVTEGARRTAGRKAAKASPFGVVVAGLIGFIAGAVCWHFVGFWGFVKEAVFYTRSDSGVVVASTRQAGAPNKVQNRQPGSALNGAAAASLNCSVAAMERAGGDLLPKACDGPVIKFRPSRNIAKADRGDFGPTPVPTLISGAGVGGPSVGGWAARIDTIETGSISPRKAE